MEIERKLAEGVAGWLLYEFQCNRSELFNERYLSTPISNILHSFYKAPVHAEVLHPVLAPLKSGKPGRRPEIDFAVIEAWPTAKCFVETKWLGKSMLSAEEIIWDLLRLELVASKTGAEAVFLIAGRTKFFLKFFQSKAFLGGGNKHRKLLKTTTQRNARLRTDSPGPERETIYKKLFEHYQDIDFYSRITTSRCGLYPKTSPAFQYQVYAWRVIPTKDPRFKPANTKLYATVAG